MGPLPHYYDTKSVSLIYRKIKRIRFHSFNNGIELCCGTCTLFEYIKVNNIHLMDIADAHCKFMREKGFNCLQGNVENVPFDQKEHFLHFLVSN